MPNYTLKGKLLQPISNAEFEASLDHPYNRDPTYRAFIVLLYYTGVRVSEALRARREAFTWDNVNLYWEVGRRLKHGRKTSPLPLNLKQPHAQELLLCIQKTRRGSLVFDFHRSTAWRHVNRGGLGYNHHARLSAITFFLQSGYSIAHIVNWFGLSVETVNHYVGLVDMQKMGAAQR